MENIVSKIQDELKQLSNKEIAEHSQRNRQSRYQNRRAIPEKTLQTNAPNYAEIRN